MGVAERRGERGQEEEQDSHYHSGLRCLVFCPSLVRRLCASVLVRRKRARRSPIGRAENTQPFVSSRPEGRENSGRSIHGLPRSVLGFQDRGCPVKVSGSAARTACLYFQIGTEPCTFTPPPPPSSSSATETCRALCCIVC